MFTTVNIYYLALTFIYILLNASYAVLIIYVFINAPQFCLVIWGSENDFISEISNSSEYTHL